MNPPLAIRRLFPLAVATAQLRPDPLETAVLLQAIDELRGGIDSNPDPGSAWTGDLNGAWALHHEPLFAALLGRIGEQAWRYLAAVGFDPAAVALHLQRCWPVVSLAGQVVGRHHHPNAHLSAVYYLNGDGSGRSGCLRLYPPARPNELVPGLAVGHGGPIRADHPLNLPWADIAPRAGLLVLFPAGVDHAVLPNEEEDDHRVSISLDYVLTAPAGGPGDPEYLAPHPRQWRAVPPVADLGAEAVADLGTGEGSAVGEDGGSS